MKDLKIALVGRPNVGKSTLFNRLTGTKHAIVDDTPGVTRDWREGKGRISDLVFTVYDTAGLEEAAKEELANRMTKKTEQAIDFCDVVLFIVDGQVGVTPEDIYFAKWLHRKNKPVTLIINKTESKHSKNNVYEFLQLGFGEYAAISAEHGEGLVSLYEVVSEHINKLSNMPVEELEDEGKKKEVLQIAITGRPNAGKSTLINALLKQDRVLTGPEPGITRDAISISWEYKGRDIKLIDTAGMRKRTSVNEDLEKLAVDDSLRSINFAQIVILLMDVNQALEAQDIQIAEKVIKEGRCLVLGFNKCDDMKHHGEINKLIKDRINQFNKYLEFVPYVILSAQNELNIYNLIDASIKVYREWNYDINKRKLNEWLEFVTEQHPLPLAPNGYRAKIKYIRQTKKRPPTFLLFTNYPDLVTDAYQRYLIRKMREDFDLPHTPIRFVIRKNNNPYAEK